MEKQIAALREDCTTLVKSMNETLEAKKALESEKAELKIELEKQVENFEKTNEENAETIRKLEREKRDMEFALDSYPLQDDWAQNAYYEDEVERRREEDMYYESLYGQEQDDYWDQEEPDFDIEEATHQ